jgi:hypothetical protein
MLLEEALICNNFRSAAANLILLRLFAECLDNVGSLTSHNPIGLQGLLRE